MNIYEIEIHIEKLFQYGKIKISNEPKVTLRSLYAGNNAREAKAKAREQLKWTGVVGKIGKANCIISNR